MPAASPARRVRTCRCRTGRPRSLLQRPQGGPGRPRYRDRGRRSPRHQPCHRAPVLGRDTSPAAPELRRRRATMGPDAGSKPPRPRVRGLGRDRVGGEHRSHLSQGSHCFRLSTRLVLGECAQHPPALAERGLLDLRPRSSQHLSASPGLQRGLHSQFFGVQTKLFQSPSLDPAGFPVLQFRERRTAPQPQGFSQHVRSPVRFPQRQQLTRPPKEPLEAQDARSSARTSSRYPCGTVSITVAPISFRSSRGVDQWLRAPPCST